MRVLADAYGLSTDQRHQLVTAIEDRFVRNERFWGERADVEQRGHAGPSAAEVLAWTRQEAAHFASSRSVFAGTLSPARGGI